MNLLYGKCQEQPGLLEYRSQDFRVATSRLHTNSTSATAARIFNRKTRTRVRRAMPVCAR